MRATGGLWLALSILPACAASYHPVDQHATGPTVLSQDGGRSILQNRRFRATIDSTTGDLIEFSAGDAGDASPLWIGATLAGRGTAHPVGHVEPRDTDTWEYFGRDDSTRIAWQKIYTLEGPWLDVTYLIQNTTPAPITAQIGLVCNDSTTHRQTDPPGEVSLDAGGVRYRFMVFDESQNTQTGGPPGQTFLHSDTERLKPGERMSWTMRWWIETPDAPPAK